MVDYFQNQDFCAPTDEELLELGFLPWQINLMRRLPPASQWDVHDEFISRLMTNNDVDNNFF